MTRARRRFAPRLAFLAVALACAGVAACGWDPRKPFERESPQVNEALREYEAGAPDAAAGLLGDYLTTGLCDEGNIGTPDRLRERPNGTFDLGLALFRIAEQYGHRFGDEENEKGFLDPNLKGRRAGQVECALRVVRQVAADPNQAIALRARARYLEGNLLFLNANYEEAVTAYDKSLELTPGMSDGGPSGASAHTAPNFRADPVGQDAAWNRAIALRRIEDKKKDAGPDSSDDGGGDGGGKGDSGGNGGDSGGGEGDEGGTPPKPPEQDAGAPPPASRQSQDERMLEQLENAPTVQQEAARKHAKTHKVRGLADK